LTTQEFQTLYKKHVKQIRNFIYYRSGDSDLADDITQETFIKLWEKQFEIKDRELKSLLYKIANDKFLDQVRRKKIEIDYCSELKFKFKEHIEQTKDNIATKQKCEKALSVLTEKERTVFLMNKKDEIPYIEIAECLNISLKAVEKRMKQAIDKLKKNNNTESKKILLLFLMLN
jgi:RNA polymerase sigma-70 factor (ECF subfamily)